jgi:hypothetical protein
VRNDDAETILGAVSLTPLGEGAMAVSYQLVGASAGDTRNLKGEVDVFEA